MDKRPPFSDKSEVFVAYSVMLYFTFGPKLFVIESSDNEFGFFPYPDMLREYVTPDW